MEDRGQSDPSGGELSGSLRRMAATLVGTLQNRIELFSLELQDEREWLVVTLVWASALVFLSGCALTLVTIAIIMLTPEEARRYVIVALCLVYIVAAVGGAVGLRKRLSQKPPAFKDTVSELKKDIACLQPRP
jgi:uncharacterized membrane protein YqjE